MSNTFLTPSIIAREALMQLKSTLVMGSLVYRDYETEFKKVGESITIKKPPVFTARDAATDISGAGLVTQNVTETGVTMTVDRWKYVRFAVGSKEKAMTLDELAQRIIRPAILPIAEEVDAYLCSLYTGIPYHAGTAGTTPDSLAALGAVGKVLMDNKVPTDDIALVMNPACQAQMWPLMAAMQSPKPTPGNPALERAQLGLINNMNCFMDQNIKTHTAGVPGGTPAASASAGATSLTIASGGNAGTYKLGDLISIATCDGQYVVTEDLTLNGSGAGTLKIYPALEKTITSQVVTLVAAHAANMAFHRNAIALATAPLEPPAGGAKGEVVTMDGITARVVYAWDNAAMSDVITIDILYGAKLVYPELAALLLG